VAARAVKVPRLRDEALGLNRAGFAGDKKLGGKRGLGSVRGLLHGGVLVRDTPDQEGGFDRADGHEHHKRSQDQRHHRRARIPRRYDRWCLRMIVSDKSAVSLILSDLFALCVNCITIREQVSCHEMIRSTCIWTA